MTRTRSVILVLSAPLLVLSLIASACGGESTKSKATKEITAACESYRTERDAIADPSEGTRGYSVADLVTYFNAIGSNITTFVTTVEATKVPGDWDSTIANITEIVVEERDIIDNIVDTLEIYQVRSSTISDAGLETLLGSFVEAAGTRDAELNADFGKLGIDGCKEKVFKSPEADETETTTTTTRSSSSGSGSSTGTVSWSTGVGLRDALLKTASSVPASQIEGLEKVLKSTFPTVKGFGRALPAVNLGEVSGATGPVDFSSGLVGWAFAVAAPDGGSSKCVIGAVWASGKPAGKGEPPSGTVSSVSDVMPAGKECTGSNAYAALDAKVK